ncbi:MAG: hypothetical protein H7177_05010 [Rhizobacter sp.]|nr:hypothetical protein [Bacteriovorax sp.]
MKKKLSIHKIKTPIIWGSFILLIATFSLHAQNEKPEDKFTFKEAPIAELGEPISLWATNYHVPEVLNGYGVTPIRDIDGVELGPNITLEEWCKAALEGTVRIHYEDGRIKTFNYDGDNELFPNDCSAFYTFNLGKSKFKLSKTPFGNGSGSFILRPYRTLATDPTIIPTGTVLYIPEARGTKILLNNGETIIHDGYFFAGDVGGAVKLDHVDVFIGVHKDSPFFPWVTSAAVRKMFNAFIVKDPEIINEMTLFNRN